MISKVNPKNSKRWVGGCRIRLQRGKTPNECPVYDTKQSDGEVPVMQELWGM